jgi:hypothetical protein
MEMQRPSAVKEWQMPQSFVLPIMPPTFFRSTPLLEHETSYFAPRVKIDIRFCKSILLCFVARGFVARKFAVRGAGETFC